jgi:hypothetical protein
MSNFRAQAYNMLISRHYGPLSFRLIMQPLVAAAFGIRAGMTDAHAARPAYGWTIVTRADGRWHLLLEGWSHVKGLFFAAVVIDVAYQVIVFRWVYPLQALIVAAILAFPSYFLIRGLTNRVVRRCSRSSDLPSSET